MNIKTLQRFVNYLNFLQIRHLLDGHDMRFVYANKNIIKMALAGTEFEPMLRLHVGSTCYLCCKNLEVTKLLKLLKKMPTHILLGNYLLTIYCRINFSRHFFSLSSFRCYGARQITY